jgi:hypothetical protein
MNLYKINEARLSRFYQVPQELIENPRYKDLNSDARITYAVLFDRLMLSKKNNWVNEKGEIYLLFEQNRLGELVGVSRRTMQRVLEMLEDFRLIKREKQGTGLPDIIYLSHMELEGAEKIVKKKQSTAKKEAAPNKEKKPMTMITDYFCDKYYEKYGEKYLFMSKDGVIISSLLKLHGANFMIEFIDWFFESEDEFISQNRTIGVLKVSRSKFIAHRQDTKDCEDERVKAEELKRKIDEMMKEGQ